MCVDWLIFVLTDLFIHVSQIKETVFHLPRLTSTLHQEAPLKYLFLCHWPLGLVLLLLQICPQNSFLFRKHVRVSVCITMHGAWPKGQCTVVVVSITMQLLSASNVCHSYWKERTTSKQFSKFLQSFYKFTKEVLLHICGCCYARKSRLR